MTTPQTIDTAEIRARHFIDGGWTPHCVGCARVWPCEAIQLADVLDAAQDEVESLTEELRHTREGLEHERRLVMDLRQLARVAGVTTIGTLVDAVPPQPEPCATQRRRHPDRMGVAAMTTAAAERTVRCRRCGQVYVPGEPSTDTHCPECSMKGMP